MESKREWISGSMWDEAAMKEFDVGSKLLNWRQSVLSECGKPIATCWASYRRRMDSSIPALQKPPDLRFAGRFLGQHLRLEPPKYTFNLQAPCILYIGQIYRYSPEYAFYIFIQQINLIIFLGFLSTSSFIPPQNVVYFLMLSFLVYKIFTVYINGLLNCKCPAPGSKG